MPEMPALGDSVECVATTTDDDDTEFAEYTWTITNTELDEDGNPVTSESSDNPSIPAPSLKAIVLLVLQWAQTVVILQNQ